MRQVSLRRSLQGWLRRDGDLPDRHPYRNLVLYQTTGAGKNLEGDDEVTKKTITMALLFGVAAVTGFADLGPMTPWEIDTRTLDDYHFFLYNRGHYISLNFLMAAIGVLCVAFLVWRLRRKCQFGTWFAVLRVLSLRLLRVLCLGLIGVLMLAIVGIYCDSFRDPLYNRGHYISLNFLMAAIGVLCVAFLVWRLRRKCQFGTWFRVLRVLSLRLLGVLWLGLLGVLLLYVIGTFSTSGKMPFCYLDVPWNRSAYDTRCLSCYESNGRENARRDGAVYRPIKPRKNAPAEVQEAYDRFIKLSKEMELSKKMKLGTEKLGTEEMRQEAQESAEEFWEH